MSSLTYTKDERESVQTSIKKNSDELTNAIKRANGVMKSLVGLKGSRIRKDMEVWQNLQKNLGEAASVLSDAAIELGNLAAENDLSLPG